jgi:hypothetical protein
MNHHFKGSIAVLFLLTLAAGHVQAAESPRQIVDSMIGAHGGMERWTSAPTVSFKVEMVPAGQAGGVVSTVAVEQGRRRAYHEIPALSARMAWDGENAWSENWTLPFPPRFAALLHYYFANLPWLTRDPGVRLASEGTAKLPRESTDYLTVRMTFDDGVGDSPRDSFLLFVNPETRRLRAVEYVSTHPAVLPKGASAMPPNLVLYEEHTTVNGLVVPTRYEFLRRDGHVPIASVRLHEWSFSKPFDASRLDMPAGGVVDRSGPDGR